MSYVSLQKQEKLRLMSKTRMSPQGGNFPAEVSIYVLRSAAGQHYNVSFQSEVQGPSAKTLTCRDATGAFLSELQTQFCSSPWNNLGYTTAAKRISGFLGPLFVRSKIDDVSTVKGTWILTQVTSNGRIEDTCIN